MGGGAQGAGAAPGAARWQRISAVVLIVGSACFNSITSDAIIAAMPAMARELGGGADSAFLAQMIAVTPSIMIIAGSPLAGLLARRIAPARLMWPLILVYAISGAYGAIAPNSTSLIASRLILGLASGLLGPLAITRTTEFPPERQAALLGFANAMAATSAIASFVGGGWMTQVFGWRTANLLNLWPLLILPFALPGCFADREPPRRRTERGGGGGEGRFPWARTLPFYALAIGIMIYIYVPALLGPFILQGRGMTNATAIGIHVSWAGLVCVGVASIYGWINRRIGWRDQLLLIFAALAVATVGLSLTRALVPTILFMAAVGIAGGMTQPMIATCLLRRVEPGQVATAYGLFASSVFLAVFITPAVFKGIRETTPLQTHEGLALFACAVLAASIGMRLFGAARGKAR